MVWLPKWWKLLEFHTIIDWMLKKVLLPLLAYQYHTLLQVIITDNAYGNHSLFLEETKWIKLNKLNSEGQFYFFFLPCHLFLHVEEAKKLAKSWDGSCWNNYIYILDWTSALKDNSSFPCLRPKKSIKCQFTPQSFQSLPCHLLVPMSPCPWSW